MENIANIAIFRINYKSDFILTLNSDAGWMTPFCIKFWTGAPSQAYFAGYDGTNYTHCAPVDGEPTKLQVQFDDHHLPIGDLKFQIGYHFTVADFPTSVEDEVINQASVIIEVDNSPEQVMLDFNGETAPEIEFSLPAYANEAQRIANEEQRIAAEQQRIANEDARIAAEETRQRNEQQRIDQETARVNEFATLKSQSQAATRDANDAATLANQKAQLAADKAALADDAATLANQKAQLAADKAALANDAAQLAADKAALAQQKAEYAQQQGSYAKNQGDYAKNQGNYAKEQGDTALADHQRAEADHGIAVDDHTQAGNDHTRAESDHGTAVDDHTQAGNDHTRAESDHGIAVNDHTQAGNDHTRAESDHGIAADDHTQAGNDHTRAESDHTRAESDHAAVEVYVDSLGAFDLSKYNAVGGVLATYADLSAALTALNALDSKYKYGGMSFKFVRTYDNKYVQCRLMSDEFTTDTTQWAIAEEGFYVENPEFVYVKTDAENKILWAIKIDGGIYYGTGVPQQIIDYINERIADLPLDEYEDIATFLSDYLGGDVTLKSIVDNLVNTKVDKVAGKSLIDADYASSQSVIDNPEYLQVTTDSEDKILEGITADGEKQINIPIDTPSATVKHIDNQEWLDITIDREGKILEGINKSGEKIFGKIPAQIDEHINKTIDKRKDEIKEEIEEELVVDIDAAASKSVFFKNYGFSPLIRGLESHPLVYSVNKFINRPLILSDGRIIYVYRGSSESNVKIINLDGTENTLLTSIGASGYRLLWMDSKKNIYAAPTLSSETYSSIGGLYRLAYNSVDNTYANEFVRVLNLYDTDVMPAVPQDKEDGQEHLFTIWTMTEDRNGRMYAGVYGQPYCPYLFVSTDSGETWSLLKNMETYAPGGKHIHFIEYNKYDNTLYCTVGEINKLLKSTDGGNNWVDMGVTLEGMKSTSILCVEDGIVLGSDYTYYGMMYKVYPDGSYRTTAKTMANQFFSIRESDVTGWLYAFGRIPGLESNSYPPSEAVTDESVLQAWIDSNPRNLALWQQYHDDMETLFPDDCIIPQHAIVLISKDRGETWELLFMTEGKLSGMGGYFHNGEIGVSLVSNRTTFIISEGKHRYTANGIDVDGEVFAKVIDGSSKIVIPII